MVLVSLGKVRSWRTREGGRRERGEGELLRMGEPRRGDGWGGREMMGGGRVWVAEGSWRERARETRRGRKRDGERQGEAERETQRRETEMGEEKFGGGSGW